MITVPLLDLKAQYTSIKAELDAAVAEVIAAQHFILGPQVKQCEDAIARYSQCRYGVGVSSGTDALVAVLMAEGIGSGDEVITTPYTFFATAGSIVRVGAKPVFVDIDPVTYNIAPALIEARVTPKTRAIIPVHLYGQMADMDAIMDIARRHRLIVIEDAAQAIGAEDHGRRAGSMGHYGCLSFFPSKNLGGFGDGGMVVTQDQERAEKVAIVRAHGSKPKYYHRVVGGNFRLDTLQAAVVLAKLRHLDSWTARRQANAEKYTSRLNASGLVSSGLIKTPVAAKSRHIYNQYVIRVQKRDELQVFLRERGIGTEVYYPVPMHVQECFAGLGYKEGAFPESERAARETLALPVYPELSEGQADHVMAMVVEFYRGAGRTKRGPADTAAAVISR